MNDIKKIFFENIELISFIFKLLNLVQSHREDIKIFLSSNNNNELTQLDCVNKSIIYVLQNINIIFFSRIIINDCNQNED